MRPLLAGGLAVLAAGVCWLSWPSEPDTRAGRREGPSADELQTGNRARADGARPPDRRAAASPEQADARPTKEETERMRVKPSGKTGVYQPPPKGAALKPRDRGPRPRQIAGMRKIDPATLEPALLATLKAIRSINAPAAVAADSSNFVQFTTDRFTHPLPDGAETRTPSLPSDTLVTAYFATKNLGAALGRCTFSWWMEGEEQPFRSVVVSVNRKWFHQVDTLELAEQEWPEGGYHVLVHTVAAEPVLVAAGSFEIRAPVVFTVSGLEALLDDEVVGASCVIDPKVKTTLTLRFSSVAAAGRTVHVTVTDAAGGSVWTEEATLESPADRPKAEQFAVTRAWAPGHYTCTVAEAGVLQRIEFTVKPPPAPAPPKD